MINKFTIKLLENKVDYLFKKSNESSCMLKFYTNRSICLSLQALIKLKLILHTGFENGFFPKWFFLILRIFLCDHSHFANSRIEFAQTKFPPNFSSSNDFYRHSSFSVIFRSLKYRPSFFSFSYYSFSVGNLSNQNWYILIPWKHEITWT